jgi:hypothetical protein
MGTRSIVYGRTESGTKGVYVHFDGYPEGRLPVLEALIKRDGVNKVASTLLARPSGWSSLDPKQDAVLPDHYNDGRFEAVPGYGVQYTDTEFVDELTGEKTQQGNREYMDTSPETRDMWIEYVYILEQDGSLSWAPNNGVDWNDLPWQSWRDGKDRGRSVIACRWPEVI